MSEEWVYNLQFPDYITEMKIGEYLFKRVDTYEDSFSKLQHLGTVSGTEYEIKSKTGMNEVTATVEFPTVEKNAVLSSYQKKPKQLHDILLLLSLFTGRDVFVAKKEDTVVADHRIHLWGGGLICSRTYESAWKHVRTGEIKSESEMKKTPVFNYHNIDIGFVKNLNNILELISTKEWQDKYSNGHFFLIYLQAVHRQNIETSFILCWTIWEHIFALHNRKWLDESTIEKMSGYEKIAFILNKYFLLNLDDKAKTGIKKLAITRNRIIHFGMKKDDTEYKEMIMFIRLTEQVMSIVLGLKPSNVFNSIEELQLFLEKKNVSDPKAKAIKKLLNRSS